MPEGGVMKTSQAKLKRGWLKWLERYGAKGFLTSFLRNVEGAESTCIYCGKRIYVDVLIGGGVADWSTEDGDFGCGFTSLTTEEGCDYSHMPRKRRIKI